MASDPIGKARRGIEAAGVVWAPVLVQYNLLGVGQQAAIVAALSFNSGALRSSTRNATHRRLIRGALLMKVLYEALPIASLGAWREGFKVYHDLQLRGTITAINNARVGAKAESASRWLLPIAPAFLQPWVMQQDVLQEHFATMIPTIAHDRTRRVYKKLLWRAGKLWWGPSDPSPGSAVKFNQWKKTYRGNLPEERLAMNCWEAVLYGLYQAGGLSKNKLRRYYNLLPATTPAHFDAKQRPLFGTATAYVAGAPAIGDILTFDQPPMLNHMGIYAGTYLGIDHILHLLSIDQASTGGGMGGSGVIHFEPVAITSGRYHGGVNVYYTPPFWVAGSPTHAYFDAL